MRRNVKKGFSFVTLRRVAVIFFELFELFLHIFWKNQQVNRFVSSSCNIREAYPLHSNPRI